MNRLTLLSTALLAAFGLACGPARDGASSSGSAAASSTSSSSSGASGESSTGTSSSTSSSSGAPFTEAAHATFPVVTQNDPTVPPHLLLHPQVVSFTYDQDSNQAALESDVDWIVTSDWIGIAGADYGVGAGTHPASVHIAGAPPNELADLDVQALISAQVSAGAAPDPGTLTNPLYMVFIHPSTHQYSFSGTGCVDYGGYHGSMNLSGTSVSYAVILDCPSFNGGGLADEEVTVSHELMEAATDPQVPNIVTYALLAVPTTPWFDVGAEVGDLCWGQILVEGGRSVQRIWSISAAAAGLDPCVPSNPAVPYFNVSVAPSDYVHAKAGSTVSLQITGWSTAPTEPWVLTAVARDGFGMLPALSDYEIRNGVTLTLTLTIPDSLPAGSQSDLWLQSSLDGLHNHIWPIAVFVSP